MSLDDTGASGNAAATSNVADGGQSTAVPAAGAQARSSMLAGGSETGGEPGQSTGEPGKQGHNSGGAFDANGDWRSGFADGLDDQTKETWGKLSSRYTSPAEMAKAHINLMQTMDKRIPIPGEDAKPEEWDAVYNKLGRPEKPDGYQFKFDNTGFDEAEQAELKGLAPLFHKARATQAQVDEFVRQQAELNKVRNDAFMAKANDLRMQRDRQLKTEWRGPDYDRNKSLVQTTVKSYAGDDFEEIASLQLSDGTFAADHPAFARMFARIGAERAEDDRDPTAFNAGMRESVAQQIEQIEQEALSKGLSPTSPGWPHKKLDALYAKKAGTKNQYTF
jgi:hypothetical protein